ncbi:MAG: PIN domain-containing protein [Flavobacteriales bacterium]|jgi:predicted nucleic acid-binding protein|nr:PIN domain-containing protein [Flavobacteriales bacterium]MBK6752321.1 PIN domain-containing protein [Flavobacteriales bacterium]MBK7084656.1 PIN domain-containing protein [Flavobacteriales bacterium]MBK7752223.1 PIN domain-containing protein [Flavobacteriales bacterium]MBK9074294.1 PIN domain-containing protein [Flavobacteriales bacterium]
MSGERILADTNILIRMFSGEKMVVDFLSGADIHVSFITEIELLATSRITDAQARKIRAFLDQCLIIGAEQEVRSYAIDFRKQTGLKLPDCIIAATGAYLNMPLVTGDKHFDKLEDEIALFRL